MVHNVAIVHWDECSAWLIGCPTSRLLWIESNFLKDVKCCTHPDKWSNPSHSWFVDGGKVLSVSGRESFRTGYSALTQFQSYGVYMVRPDESLVSGIDGENLAIAIPLNVKGAWNGLYFWRLSQSGILWCKYYSSFISLDLNVVWIFMHADRDHFHLLR